MDRDFYVKSLNMNEEFHISGRFLYHGLEVLYNIKSLERDSEIFDFLYHVSIGIERLQKIIILLSTNISFENNKEIEKSLITHSASKLQGIIYKNIKLRLTNYENKVLTMLTKFYKTYRYQNFLYDANRGADIEYFITCCQDLGISIEQSPGFRSQLPKEGKEKLINIIGGIISKYYEALKDLAYNLNIYTYELEADSKAAFIFWGSSEKLYNKFVLKDTSNKEVLLHAILMEPGNLLKQYKLIDIKALPLEEYDLFELYQELANHKNNAIAELVVYHMYEEFKQKKDIKDRVLQVEAFFNYYELTDEYELQINQDFQNLFNES